MGEIPSATLLVTLGILPTFSAIWHMRNALNAERTEIVEREENGEQQAGGKGRSWHVIWPWFALLYVSVTSVVALANPSLIMELIGRAKILYRGELGHRADRPLFLQASGR